uniref:Putative secreted protein n=1 Tax=Anopheles darlingi TaxID=43151 RepID=A0A2M4DD78_ANODA
MALGGWGSCAQKKMCLRRLSWAFFFFLLLLSLRTRQDTVPFPFPIRTFLQLFNQASLSLSLFSSFLVTPRSSK